MSCNPWSQSNKRCPWPSAPPSRSSSLVQAAWRVRMQTCWLERDGEQSCRMLNSRPSAMLLDRSGRGRGGRKRSTCSICWSEAARFKRGRLLSSALMQHPGPSIHVKQPFSERRGGSRWAVGMGKYGLSASQAELRPVLRTDKKPRTEPKLHR
jgi:hypothetical protein